MQIFIKQNPIPGSTSLECEVQGLAELKKYQAQHGLQVPKIIKVSSEELHLEKISLEQASNEDWAALGRGLVQLHSVTGDQFGFENDNFIGLNPQKNTKNKNWGEFYFNERLSFQVGLLQDPSLKQKYANLLEEHRSKLMSFLNQHDPKPSLVHGDLWSGNVMFDDKGPWLIDPAVYYGDPEVDLAMSKIFGGFAPVFYEAYMESSPLSAGYEVREKIYNLYHYLNHLNLFGESYLGGVEEGFQVISKL